MVRTAGTHIAINPTPKYSMVDPDTKAALVFSSTLLMSISYLPGLNTGLVWCSRCARNIARTMSVKEIQNFAGVKSPGRGAANQLLTDVQHLQSSRSRPKN
jgi:hypothetical protein